MIELGLLILSILTNGTDSTSSTECCEDYYGPGPTDDLLDRGTLDCRDCPENYYDDDESSAQALLLRPIECDGIFEP
jgi:hypothetical protein